MAAAASLCREEGCSNLCKDDQVQQANVAGCDARLPPTLYHVVIDEYMGLAILEHLCTAGDFNFRASFRLPDDSTYTMVSIHFGGMQVTGGRDSRHWDLSESGCCSQVHALISDMAEVARVSMDHGNEYTVGGGCMVSLGWWSRT